MWNHTHFSFDVKEVCVFKIKIPHFLTLPTHNFLTVHENIYKKSPRGPKNVLREMDFELLSSVFFVSLYTNFSKIYCQIG